MNQDKCHLMISGHKFEAVWAKITQTQIWGSREKKVTENNYRELFEFR